MDVPEGLRQPPFPHDEHLGRRAGDVPADLLGVRRELDPAFAAEIDREG